MTGKTWFRIRLGLMIFAFIASLVTPFHQFDDLSELSKTSSWMVWTMRAMAILFILAIPLWLQLIFAIQAVNPFSDKTWPRPTHQSNPLHLGNPLLFFHFGAYFIGAGSLGVLLSALWNGLPALLGGLVGIVGAFLILLGVHLAMRLFKGKMAGTS